MRITPDQLNFIKSEFDCERISSSQSNFDILKNININITAPKETSLYYKQSTSLNILERIKEYSKEYDTKDEEAVYVLKNKQQIALIFSIKTGALYKTDELENAIKKEQEYIENRNTLIEEGIKLFNTRDFSSQFSLSQILESLNIPDADLDKLKTLRENYAKRQTLSGLYTTTKEKDEKANKKFHYVLKTYPAIDLVIFWKNPEFEVTWRELIKDKNFPDEKKYSMADILFWTFIVDKIQEISEQIGITHIFLFAADKSIDMNLISHYIELGFSNDTLFSTLKPRYDFSCIFMYQSLTNLIERRNSFLQDFNSDDEEN